MLENPLLAGFERDIDQIGGAVAVLVSRLRRGFVGAGVQREVPWLACGSVDGDSVVANGGLSGDFQLLIDSSPASYRKPDRDARGGTGVDERVGGDDR